MLNYKILLDIFYLSYANGANTTSKPSISGVIGIWQPNLLLGFT